MLYNIIILESSISSCVMYNHVTMTITCNITLTPNPKSKNKKINENKIEI